MRTINSLRLTGATDDLYHGLLQEACDLWPREGQPEVRQCNRVSVVRGDLNARAFTCTLKCITGEWMEGWRREGRNMERSMISIAREVMDSGHGYVAHETLIEESRRKLHALRGRDALIECIIYRHCTRRACNLCRRQDISTRD